MSQVDQQEITTALLQSVESGVFPESQDVAAAELSSTALPAVAKAVQAAKKAVEDDICSLSREAAPQIDGWIQQAQQLQNDIERSKAVAKEIVKQAEEASSLRQEKKDVASKLELLRAEVEFNRRLKETLESIQGVAATLQAGQDATAQGRLNSGLEQYERAQSTLASLKTAEGTVVVDLLKQRASRLHAALVESTEQLWDSLVALNREQSLISIYPILPGNDGTSLEETTNLMRKLDVFEPKVMEFCHNLNDIILKPRLKVFSGHTVAQVHLKGEKIQLDGLSSNSGSVQLISDLTAILNYLAEHLPRSVVDQVSEILMPSLISGIISSWLNTSFNASLDSLPDYQAILNIVSEFASFLNERGWHGASDLSEWVEDAPKVWLAKRRELSLTSVRDSLDVQIHNTKVVERVETEIVTEDDVIAPTIATAEDWDAGWGEEDDSNNPAPPVQAPEDEEDLSAWLDDGPISPSAETPSSSENQQQMANENGTDDAVEEADAWGWGDDPEQPVEEPTPAAASTEKALPNGHSPEGKPRERKLTLKENYTVTGVPDKLLELILELVADASNLKQPQFAESPIAAAAAAIFSIPTLALAGFRALAPTYYGAIEGGNMYLYNDSLRLTSELADFQARQAEEDAASALSKSAWPSSRMKLEADIDALSNFGKRAYGKEMEAQRTILGDLLDSAQAFANCTEEPFAAECRNAVTMTIDRLREVKRQWAPILSRSALFQSLGSLLHTVLNKVIADICDLSDISEDASVRLKEFCDEFQQLSDLFVDDEAASEAQKDATGMYAQNWFKLQYLAEILESSLADIEYLWQEGGLKEEFGVEEIVDLVEALFAESDRRRRLIAFVRRG